MKEKGCLYFFGEMFLLIEAIIMVSGGERGIEYILVLFFSASLLVTTIIGWLVKEIKIRKKMKQLEEERKKHERPRDGDHR